MARGFKMEHVHLDTIYEEGRKLLRQGGLEAMTLRNVARSLGCSPSVMYHHLCKVEDLRRGVAELVLKECARTIRLPLRRTRWNLTATGRFMSRLQRYRTFWTREPQALELVFRTTAHHPVARQKYFALLLVEDLVETVGIFAALGWWARLHGVVVLECTRIVDAITAERLWWRAVHDVAKEYEQALARGPYEPTDFDEHIGRAA